jgi:hypothetical protein
MLANLYISCLLIAGNITAEGFCNFKNETFTFEKYFETKKVAGTYPSKKCKVINDKKPIVIKGKTYNNHMAVVTCEKN